MSLLQEIEEYEKKMKAEQDGEVIDPVVEEEIVEGGEDEDVDPAEDEEVTEPVKEEPPVPALSQSEQNAAFMQLRRELAEHKRKLQEIEAAKQPKPVDTDPEPDKAENYEGWLEWKVRALENTTSQIAQRVNQSEQQAQAEYAIKRGIEEFNNYEADFRKKAPDYDAAAEHMRVKMEESLMLLNPLVTASQAKQAVQTNLLQMASQYAQAGMNPVEQMYNMAKERFQYKAAPVEADKEPAKRQNLAKVAANSKRAASSLQGGGAGSAETSLEEAVLNMSTAAMMRLDPETLRRLESGV